MEPPEIWEGMEALLEYKLARLGVFGATCSFRCVSGLSEVAEEVWDLLVPETCLKRVREVWE